MDERQRRLVISNYNQGLHMSSIASRSDVTVEEARAFLLERGYVLVGADLGETVTTNYAARQVREPERHDLEPTTINELYRGWHRC